MNKLLIEKFFPFTIVFITLSSAFVYAYSWFSVAKIFTNTSVWWFFSIVSLYTFYLIYKTNRQFVSKDYFVLKLYLIWIVVSIIRGFFIAETYWDWKGLIANAFALLLPIAVYLSINPVYPTKLLRIYINYMIPAFVLIAFVIYPGAYGFYLAALSFLILTIPYATRKWKIILIIISIMVIFADLSARSNVIKTLLPLFFLGFYIFRPFVRTRIIRALHSFFMIIPFILFLLASFGIFNVFQIEKYIQRDLVVMEVSEGGVLTESDLKADTRTALYKEVLQTANKHSTWLWGRSPARGNETELFSSLSDITGRQERLSNEVAILNIFTWLGGIGVVFYFLIFYKASYLAIFQSRNQFIKVLGLFIAFRWVYAWVEDINHFTLTTFSLWLMIGICYSKQFRMMTDRQIGVWIRSLYSNTFKKKIKDDRNSYPPHLPQSQR